MKTSRVTLLAVAACCASLNTACGTGSHTIPSTAPNERGAVDYNVCPQQLRRSASIARPGQRAPMIGGTICDNNDGGPPAPGPNADPFYFQTENFLEIVSAVDGGVDPCDASTPICAPYVPGAIEQIAAAGKDAARGDNCTAYNTYAVGFGIAGASPTTPSFSPNTTPTPANGPNTIVNQTIVAVNYPGSDGTKNSQPFGWLLVTENAGTWFVPDVTVTFGIASVNTPAAVNVSKQIANQKQMLNALRGVLNAFSNKYNLPLLSNLNSRLQNTSSTGLSEEACFQTPLNPNT